MENPAPPSGLVVGNEWWQQLFSYGLSRAVDAEFLKPFYPATDAQYGIDAFGNSYRLGQPAGAAPGSAQLSVGMLALGALVLYLALRD